MADQSMPDISEEPPFLLYEDSQGQIQLCSLNTAQRSLRDGYFTSEMKYACVATEEGEEENGQGDVHTINEAIEMNGRAMPFLAYDQERRRNEKETIRLMNMELAELYRRKSSVLASIQSLQNRLADAQLEMKQFEERNELVPLPSLLSRSSSMYFSLDDDQFDLNSLHPQGYSRRSSSIDSLEHYPVNVSSASTPNEDDISFEAERVLEEALERLKNL